MKKRKAEPRTHLKIPTFVASGLVVPQRVRLRLRFAVGDEIASYRSRDGF